MVVNDDRVNREIISRHLTALGYEVVACADGQDAWEIIESQEISLVVTDRIMPRMDGIELCNKIRQTHTGHYIYTIIVTSKDEQQDLIHGMDAGADDFLVKPVTSDALRAIRVCLWNVGLRSVTEGYGNPGNVCSAPTAPCERTW